MEIKSSTTYIISLRQLTLLIAGSIGLSVASFIVGYICGQYTCLKKVKSGYSHHSISDQIYMQLQSNADKNSKDNHCKNFVEIRA